MQNRAEKMNTFVLKLRLKGRHIATLLLASLSGGHFLEVAAQESDMKMALEAPAGALAQSYLSVKNLMQYVAAAEAGANIQVGSEKFSKDNAQAYRVKYEKGLLLYTGAIKQRGYKSVSGTYKGEATGECKKAQTVLGLISEAGLTAIEITQDGFDAQLVLKGMQGGREYSVRNPMVIVESAVVVADAMNSNYFFQGAMGDGVIEIKPMLSALDTWPKWAGPPSRSDLEKCTFTLKPT